MDRLADLQLEVDRKIADSPIYLLKPAFSLRFRHPHLCPSRVPVGFKTRDSEFKWPMKPADPLLMIPCAL